MENRKKNSKRESNITILRSEEIERSKKFEKRRICRENEFMRDQTRVSKRMIELKSKKNM